MYCSRVFIWVRHNPGMKSARRLARTCSIALHALGFALALCATVPAMAQSCSFKANQPGSVSFGVINPTLATTATFSVTLAFKCNGGAVATFNIAGQNDTGPGAYRLKHASLSQYMAYSVSTVLTAGVDITLNGQIVASTYQNAYAGSYSDSLTVTIFP